MLHLHLFFLENNKLSMQECADFYDSQLEQRFAVLNEELHSVCSKFATGWCTCLTILGSFA